MKSTPQTVKYNSATKPTPGHVRCVGLKITPEGDELHVRPLRVTSVLHKAEKVCQFPIPIENATDVAEALAKAAGGKRKVCVFIEASSLVPPKWAEWFWAMISENAPFGFGDNNRTMVTATRFADHIDATLSDPDDYPVSPRAVKDFLKRIRALGDTYIDLEN